jgi:hypothetical protein
LQRKRARRKDTWGMRQGERMLVEEKGGYEETKKARRKDIGRGRGFVVRQDTWGERMLVEETG